MCRRVVGASGGRLLCATMLAAAFGACGSESPVSSGPAVALVVSGAGRPGEALVVGVRGYQVQNASFSGTLGPTAVRLARLNDSTLCVLVPDVAPGDVALTLQLGSQQVNAVVRVVPGMAFANPRASIETLLVSIETALPVIAPPGSDAGAWGQDVAGVTQRLASVRSALATAPPAVLLAVARLLASLETPAAVSSSEVRLADDVPTTADCDDTRASSRVAGGKTAVALVATAAACALTLVDPALFPVCALGTVATLMYLLEWVNAIQRAVFDDCLWLHALAANQGQAALAAAGSRGSVSGRRVVIIPRDAPVPLSISGTYRTLSQADVPSNATAQELARMGLEAADAIVDVQDLGVDVNSAPVQLTTVTTTVFSTVVLDLAHLRFERVQPSTVSLTPGSGAAGLQVSAASQDPDDVPFTFDVIADGPAGSSARATITATLETLLWLSVPSAMQGMRFTGPHPYDPTDTSLYQYVMCRLPITIQGSGIGVYLSMTGTVAFTNGTSLNPTVDPAFLASLGGLERNVVDTLPLGFAFRADAVPTAPGYHAAFSAILSIAAPQRQVTRSIAFDCQ